MELSNRIVVKQPYAGQSKFPFWKELKAEDVLVLSVKLASPGRTSRGLYATEVKIQNVTQNTSFRASLTETSKYLSRIKYAE
jgi:hypothetical protein